MTSKETFDISFNFSSDTPDGKDMDAYSPTLRRYHQLLWSKPLPSGAPFDLTYSGSYLRHSSELGEFELASDQAVHTFSKWKKTKHIIDQIPAEETADFVDRASTIGAMMIFPGNKVDGKMTINGSRGLNYYIGDRLDLTLECIRRHYLAEASPLSETLARYSDFFGLFGDFAGYTDFFLLQDLVDDPGLTVKFYLPFDNFVGSPIPRDLDAYLAYRERVLGFITARSQRIAKQMSAR